MGIGMEDHRAVQVVHHSRLIEDFLSASASFFRRGSYNYYIPAVLSHGLRKSHGRRCRGRTNDVMSAGMAIRQGIILTEVSDYRSFSFSFLARSLLLAWAALAASSRASCRWRSSVTYRLLATPAA